MGWRLNQCRVYSHVARVFYLMAEEEIMGCLLCYRLRLGRKSGWLEDSIMIGSFSWQGLVYVVVYDLHGVCICCMSYPHPVDAASVYEVLRII